MNDGQRRFVEAYLKEPNATKAALAAGYAPKTAKQQGARLLSNVAVRDALVKATDRRAEQTNVDAAWLLNRLAEMANVDLRAFFDAKGRLRPLGELNDSEQRLVSSFEVQEVWESPGNGEERRLVATRLTKVKLTERLKILEMIGRHVSVAALRDSMRAELDLPVVRIRDFTNGAYARPEVREVVRSLGRTPIDDEPEDDEPYNDVPTVRIRHAYGRPAGNRPATYSEE